MKLVIKTVHQTLKTLSRGRQNLLLNSPPHTDTTFESHSSMSCLVFLSSNFLYMKNMIKTSTEKTEGTALVVTILFFFVFREYGTWKHILLWLGSRRHLSTCPHPSYPGWEVMEPYCSRHHLPARYVLLLSRCRHCDRRLYVIHWSHHQHNAQSLSCQNS